MRTVYGAPIGTGLKWVCEGIGNDMQLPLLCNPN